MCQLNFSNLKKKEYNGIYYLLQSWENALLNKDGFGFYTDDYLLKSKINMNNCYNVGELLYKHYDNDGPILSHCRLATVGGNNKKNIEDESSHPFEGDHFILAHNGVLELKTPNDKYKDVPVDSLVFLYELEDRYEKDKDIVKSIEDTINLFYGTFAFLIYHKESKSYYAAKGKTKLLHISKVVEKNSGEQVGYVLNTNGLDAEIALLRLRNMCNFLYGVDLVGDKPKDLDQETIYLLDKDEVKKVGIAKESYKPVVAKAHDYGDDYYSRGSSYYKKDYTVPADIFKPFESFMLELNLEVHEIDIIVWRSVGKGLVELTEKDCEWIIKNVFSKHRGYFTKTKFNVWKELKNEAKGRSLPNVPYYLYLYYKYDLKFPYYINSKEELNKCLKELKNENANSIQ